jgi:hypothetical protein
VIEGDTSPRAVDAARAPHAARHPRIKDPHPSWALVGGIRRSLRRRKPPARIHSELRKDCYLDWQIEHLDDGSERSPLGVLAGCALRRARAGSGGVRRLGRLAANCRGKPGKHRLGGEALNQDPLAPKLLFAYAHVPFSVWQIKEFAARYCLGCGNDLPNASSEPRNSAPSCQSRPQASDERRIGRPETALGPADPQAIPIGM